MKLQWSRICFALIFLFGIILTIMVPPWQTPDEPEHLKNIGESIYNENLASELLGDLVLGRDRIRFQSEEKLKLDDWRASMTKAPEYNRSDCMPKGVSLFVVKHLPATIGILLGILLHLPTFWVLELGEIFSLLFYVIVSACALRLMPVKKEVLMMFIALPICVQQAASISYDAVLLPLCYLFIAYILYMRYEKKSLGWLDVAATLALLMLIFYIKIPYLFLGLLVFLLPAEKIHLKVGRYEINGEIIRRFKIPAGILLLGLVALGLYLVRDNFWVQLVGGMAMEWKRSIYLLIQTIRTWRRFLLVSSVGSFGYLDSELPFAFVLFTYLFITFLAVWNEKEENPYRLKRGSRLFVWVVFGVLSVFVMLSMVNHTIMITLFGAENANETYQIREAIYQIGNIGGLQGRYFIPFLPLLFTALPEIGKTVKWKSWAVLGYILLAMVLTIYTLYFRYWVG